MANRKNHLKSLEIGIFETEERLKLMISQGLEAIRDDPSMEKEIGLLLTDTGKSIYDYFIKEADRTGNSKIGKSIVKFMMFKKF